MTILRRIKSRWIAWRYGPIFDYLLAIHAYQEEKHHRENFSEKPDYWYSLGFMYGVRHVVDHLNQYIKRREELILP